MHLPSPSPERSLPRFSLGALAGATLLALACGGPSVDPTTQMDAVCHVTGDVPISGALATVDVPVAPLSQGVSITLENGRILLDGSWEEDLDGLAADLGHAVMTARAVREAAGGSGLPPVVLQLAPDLPVARVGEVLRACHAAGLTSAELVVWSTQPLDVPPYPDPAYGAELEAEIASVSPEARAMVLAEEIGKLSSLCPGMTQVLDAVAFASPESRCELLYVGMGEALPSCPLTDGDAVMTAVQVMATAGLQAQPTAIAVTLDPEATPLELGAAQTWADAAPVLAARAGQAIWLP